VSTRSPHRPSRIRQSRPLTPGGVCVHLTVPTSLPVFRRRPPPPHCPTCVRCKIVPGYASFDRRRRSSVT
jgi:hypothetical protein